MAAERALGAFRPLALRELACGDARQLRLERLGAMLPVARDRERRRGPEHALDVPGLDVHDLAVRQKHAGDHLVPAGVHPEQEPEGLAAPAPRHHEAPGLGLRDGAGGAPPAAAQRRARRLHFGAELPVASDPGEIAAGRPEAARVLHRHLELGDLGLEPADAPEILVLAERGLHGAADRRHVVAAAQEQGHRPVAQLELAHHRLRRAVHHAANVVHPVANIEGNNALAFGIDTAAAPRGRPSGSARCG
jgi:hypothetical protein